MSSTALAINSLLSCDSEVVVSYFMTLLTDRQKARLRVEWSEDDDEDDEDQEAVSDDESDDEPEEDPK